MFVDVCFQHDGVGAVARSTQRPKVPYAEVLTTMYSRTTGISPPPAMFVRIVSSRASRRVFTFRSQLAEADSAAKMS